MGTDNLSGKAGVDNIAKRVQSSVAILAADTLLSSHSLTLMFSWLERQVTTEPLECMSKPRGANAHYFSPSLSTSGMHSFGCGVCDYHCFRSIHT